jgi:hypothetical protein
MLRKKEDSNTNEESRIEVTSIRGAKENETWLGGINTLISQELEEIERKKALQKMTATDILSRLDKLPENFSSQNRVGLSELLEFKD